jgi:GNAT superfamily N-acetyltransferase
MARPPGHIPAGTIPGWPEEFSPGSNLTFKHAIGEDIARWWQESIYERTHLFPGGFAEKLSEGLPGDHSYIYHQIDPVTRFVKLEMLGSTSSIPIWLHEQHIFLQNETVFESAVIIDNPYQGQGFGKQLISNVYGVARDLGIVQITLSAAMMGKYFWAQLGFLPDRDSWESLLRPGIHSKLLSLGKHVPDDVRIRVLRLLESLEPETIRAIADFRDLVPSSIKEYMTADGRQKMIPLGMALLAEIDVPWYGVLDLRDNDSVEVFQNEIRRRRK